MTPMKHQVIYADKLYSLLKTKGYAYLAGKPRSGKTYTAILTAEKSDKIDTVLVLTKKKAIPGWMKFIEGNNRLKHKYIVINYEQVSKRFTELKGKFQLVIIDESHNLGALPKMSKRTVDIAKLCANVPHLHLSGTAIVETPLSIFNQMKVSKFRPFNEFKNFYEFFREYGIPESIYVAGREVKQYKKAKLDLLMPLIDEFTIYMSQEDAGIDKNVQAIDKVHYIDLPKDIKKLYNTLQKDRIIEVLAYKCTNCDSIVNFDVEWDGDIVGYCSKCKANKVVYEDSYEYVADSVMKLRVGLHQLEGGTLKIDNSTTVTLHDAKLNYIKKTFDLTKKIGIMCHFKAEQDLIKTYLPNVEVYSSNAHSEGVDLSHLDTFIIYSNDYSGSKFIQRRERIINIEGSNTLEVHHLLVKNAISDQVYQTVSKKQDFNNSTYERREI